MFCKNLSKIVGSFVFASAFFSSSVWLYYTIYRCIRILTQTVSVLVSVYLTHYFKRDILYQGRAATSNSPTIQDNVVLSSKREVSVTTTSSSDASSVSNSGLGVFAKGLASGSVTRAVKEIVLHPIDTVKSRIQTATVNATSNDIHIYNLIMYFTSLGTIVVYVCIFYFMSPQ